MGALDSGVLSYVCARPTQYHFYHGRRFGVWGLGLYGQQRIKTPNIDRLGSGGIKFTDYYSGAAVCAPARSVLMSGLHTGHTRVRGNFGKGGVVGLAGKKGRVPIKKEDLTVAEVLQEQGYRTAMIGKWGLGEPIPVERPTKKGSTIFGFYNQRRAHSYYPEYLWKTPKNNTTRKRAGGESSVHTTIYLPTKPSILSTEITTNPFSSICQFASHTADMNSPMMVCIPQKNWTDLQKKYAAMVTRLDETVGRIVKRLEVLGIAENTLHLLYFRQWSSRDFWRLGSI